MPDVAALIAVPLPFNNPVMVVPMVMAGVVEGFDTTPENPLPLVTEIEVTVPEPLTTAQLRLVPLVVRNFPEFAV